MKLLEKKTRVLLFKEHRV